MEKMNPFPGGRSYTGLLLLGWGWRKWQRTASPRPHTEFVLLLLPHPRHLSHVKQVTSLGRYFGVWLFQVKMGRGRGRGSAGHGWRAQAREVLVIPAWLPTAAEQEVGGQRGMLICHELTCRTTHPGSAEARGCVWA